MFCLRHFDDISGVNHGSGTHTRRLDADDLAKVIKDLIKMNVFSNISGRKHTFPKLYSNLLRSVLNNDYNLNTV